MGFQSTHSRYRKKQDLIPSIAPYYGLSTVAVATSAMVLGLTGRGPTHGVIDTTFTLNALNGSGNYMYFAYPASWGTAKFLDVDSNFYGGWDGANDDPMNVYGPSLLTVSISGTQVQFYVYRTDYPDLGLCHWVASVDVAG